MSQETSLRQEGGGCPGTFQNLDSSSLQLPHGCSCTHSCGCLQEGVSRQMGPGGGADRYGFPGGKVSALGERSLHHESGQSDSGPAPQAVSRCEGTCW